MKSKKDKRSGAKITEKECGLRALELKEKFEEEDKFVSKDKPRKSEAIEELEDFTEEAALGRSGYDLDGGGLHEEGGGVEQWSVGEDGCTTSLPI